MYVPPSLNDVQVRVLRVIDQRGVVRGRDILRRTGLDSPETLVDAVRDLLKYELIDVTGDPHDEKGIVSAVFSVRPSANSAVKYATS